MFDMYSLADTGSLLKIPPWRSEERDRDRLKFGNMRQRHTLLHQIDRTQWPVLFQIVKLHELFPNSNLSLSLSSHTTNTNWGGLGCGRSKFPEKVESQKSEERK